MTAGAESPGRSKHLRAAQGMAVGGMGGMLVAMFLPNGEYSGSPAHALFRNAGYGGNWLWVLLPPFLFAALLLLVRLWRALLRFEHPVQAESITGGWPAMIGSFILLLAVDVGTWPGNLSQLSFYPSFEPDTLRALALLAATGAATFAAASLCAAPARVRLAACGIIMGALGLCFFGILLWPAPGAEAAWGLRLAFFFSFLVAAGSAWETVLLWRHGTPSEETA